MFTTWRPLSVNLSHLNLLIWKFLVKWNQSLKEWCLDCPLPNFLLSFWNFYKWTSITIYKGWESVHVFYSMFISIAMETQLLRRKVSECINWFNPTIFLCLFRARTFISVGICPFLFVYLGFKVVFPLLILEELLITTV